MSAPTYSAPWRTHVPVAPLQEAYLARPELGASDIARRLGWMRPSYRPGDVALRADASRLLRSLGLRGHRGHGRTLHRQQIGRELALRIADAMDLDPVDVGL